MDSRWVCWAFFFAVNFGHKLDFSLRTAIEIAVRITVPVAWFGRKILMRYYPVILLNAATYALVGLAVEPFWRRKKVSG